MNQLTAYRRWTIFAIISIGTFMALFSATSVNAALPLLEKEFNASLSGIQWVVTCYFLIISSFLPIFGWAGDMWQRKYVIALGFLIFGIGGFFCGQADTLPELIIARLIQGIGASMNMANSFAAMTNTFPASQRGRILGMQGSMVALGGISGPPIGGFILDLFDWHWIFFMTLPLALTGFVTALLFIPKDDKGKTSKFDFIGAILLVIAISSLTIVLSQWGREGWSNTEILCYLIATIISFLVFYKWEKRIKYPLVDINMFKNKVFLMGNCAGLCSFLALNSTNMLTPFYLHKVFDATPSTIGMILIFFPIMFAIAAPVSGTLSDKYGAPKFAIAGMLLMTSTLICLAFFAKSMILWIIVVLLGLLGASNGMFQAPNNSTTLEVIPIEKHGMAGSIVALMRNFGTVVGIALGVRICDKIADISLTGNTITPQAEKIAFIYGYQAAMLVGAFFAFVALLFSLQKRSDITKAKEGAE